MSGHEADSGRSYKLTRASAEVPRTHDRSSSPRLRERLVLISIRKHGRRQKPSTERVQRQLERLREARVRAVHPQSCSIMRVAAGKDQPGQPPQIVERRILLAETFADQLQ